MNYMLHMEIEHREMCEGFMCLYIMLYYVIYCKMLFVLHTFESSLMSGENHNTVKCKDGNHRKATQHTLFIDQNFHNILLCYHMEK